LIASTGALSLFLAACGGDDSSDDAGETAGSATQTETTPTTDDPGTTGDDPTTATTPTTDDPTTGTDPDTSTGAAACATDVCATYGAAVPIVAGQIVDVAAADPLFMDDFAPLVAEGPAAVDAFKASLTNFITDAYGCTTGAYTGPTMEAAHAGMGITQPDYDAFIGIIVGVLTDNGVPDDDINFCFAPPLVDPAFVATIVGQ
jgi:hypothetical protein